MSEKHRKIGKILQELEKKGISQLELSLLLGHKSVSIVASAERHYRGAHFNLNHLFQMAEIFEIDICDFFK